MERYIYTYRKRERSRGREGETWRYRGMGRYRREGSSIKTTEFTYFETNLLRNIMNMSSDEHDGQVQHNRT